MSEILSVLEMYKLYLIISILSKFLMLFKKKLVIHNPL
jgi:hypothetical protein